MKEHDIIRMKVDYHLPDGAVIPAGTTGTIVYPPDPDKDIYLIEFPYLLELGEDPVVSVKHSAVEKN